ncbi:hypothetical protein LTR35_018089 [Friedmanniomyces endolithicus]|uniref:Uncharacterized protein n=1 Tax=Friedmanniomyces endolithicus TaxID=329885 RepID=A0AAN6F3K6_9PEZI|nr:hypothetical protein LTR35_018089 [Friedmanniomyces endolithicus]KAK0266963.1 hypothetical protein LTS00_017901 [Friedmanniomyces endolithicus]KAK0301982.1 hypothetical protein LTR82_018043 [Friedmanniomyces endolithicus]KAK0969012.1 hypothetical protein LTR54_018150 [Friedmanniomyces endolithicus]
MPPPQGSWNRVEGPGDYPFTNEVHNDTYAAIDPTKADHVGHSGFNSGASKGLGRALALSLAKSSASEIAVGARSELTEVVAAIRQAANEAGRPEPKVLAVKLDVRDQASVEAATEKIAADFGKLDVVINSAEIIEPVTSIVDSSPDVWWSVWEVNVRGSYLISRSCIPLLLKGKLDTLIMISSVGAHVIIPGLSAYQPGKLAITRFMEFAAAKYKDQGLVPFSVHSGNVLSDIISEDTSYFQVRRKTRS